MFKPPNFIEQSNFESHFVLFQTTVVKRCQTCQSRNPRTSNSTAPLAIDRTSGAAAKHGRSHSITNKILWTNDKWWQMNTRSEARNSFFATRQCFRTWPIWCRLQRSIPTPSVWISTLHRWISNDGAHPTRVSGRRNSGHAPAQVVGDSIGQVNSQRN